jgi:hypothetical protein
MAPKLRWALVAGLAGLAALAGAGLADAAGQVDRLDRFRELAASRLALAQLLDEESSAEALREIYALLDDEIVDSLVSGGPFASLAFLQDRLDTFGEAWGGAVLRLVQAGDLLVGAFTLDERASGNSVRVYGALRGEPALLRAFYRAGRPSVYRLPGGATAPLLVAWEGPASGWGTRTLRVDLLRRDGDAVRVAWSTASLFGDDLRVRSWSVRGGELRIRYEVRYPGWAPGCQDQTEQEDVYRMSPTGEPTRVARREHDAWHRDLHAAVERLVGALGARDDAAVAALVPDRALRRRLPPTLRAEPTCDARDGAGAETVSVAAAAERQPWTLTFRRLGSRWRLTGASPVLQ